jgi:hypothetical protein
VGLRAWSDPINLHIGSDFTAFFDPTVSQFPSFRYMLSGRIAVVENARFHR